MALVKAKASNAPYYFIKSYLEKNGRALAVDLYHIDTINGNSWDKAMEKERFEMIKNSEKDHVKAIKRTYTHYILSPDPKDEVTLEELREFCKEWCKNNLHDYQAAITYHNDNKSGILHAHVIINNFNSIDNKCFSTYLTHKRRKQVKINTQQMCKDRGWHSFDAENYEHDPKDLITTFQSDEEMEKINKAKDFYTTQSKYKGKAEREILESGNWSWKEDLRVRVDIARSASKSIEGFEEILRVLGVKCSSNAKKNDWIYTHPENENWRCGGNKLGRMYSYQSLEYHFQNKHDRPYGVLARHSFRELAKSIGISSIKIYETVTEENYTLQEFGDALAYNEKNEIKSEDDYNKLINHYKNENNTEKVEQLEKYKMICGGLVDKQELIEEEHWKGSYERAKASVKKYEEWEKKHPRKGRVKTQREIRRTSQRQTGSQQPTRQKPSQQR